MDPLELSLVRSHIADLQRDAALHRTLAAAAPRPTPAPFLMTLDALAARVATTARALLRPRTAAGPEVCCA
jgi:hypothetical protein